MFSDVLRFDSVGSTQDVARAHWQSGNFAEAGSGVVASNSMEAGRGRRGRTWHVPPGANVCLTAVAQSPVPVGMLWQLSLTAGVAVVAALRELHPACPVRLRFPNDITLNGRKLGGILIETFHDSGKLVALVGIGVNVLVANRPDELRQTAIALQDCDSAPDAEVHAVESSILRALAESWQRLESGQFPGILAEWHAQHDSESVRTFVRDGNVVPCRVAEIFADGSVRLLVHDGTESLCMLEEVLFGDD